MRELISPQMFSANDLSAAGHFLSACSVLHVLSHRFTDNMALNTKPKEEANISLAAEEITAVLLCRMREE